MSVVPFPRTPPPPALEAAADAELAAPEAEAAAAAAAALLPLEAALAAALAADPADDAAAAAAEAPPALAAAAAADAPLPACHGRRKRKSEMFQREKRERECGRGGMSEFFFLFRIL